MGIMSATEYANQRAAYYTPNQPFIKATEVLEVVEKRCGAGQQYTTFSDQISDEEKAKVESKGYIVTRNYVQSKNRDDAPASDNGMYIGFQVALNAIAASGHRPMQISEEEDNGISGGGIDVGESTEGMTFTVDETTYTAGEGSERFNDYTDNASIGQYSHVEGQANVAVGGCTHAGGYNSLASAFASFAHGRNTQATHDSETAFGKFNQSNSDTLFSVGNGVADDNRGNAFEVKNSGNVISSGYYADKTGHFLVPVVFITEAEYEALTVKEPVIYAITDTQVVYPPVS